MLNPDLLSNKQKKEIKSKFIKLKSRKILPILEEFESKDRIDFDNTVFDAFGIQVYKDQVVSALKTLYEIRMNIRGKGSIPFFRVNKCGLVGERK